jgi:hypothetical protein
MFDLNFWEMGGQYRLEEDRRREERGRLLAELRRSRPPRPSRGRRALRALGTLLIACGEFLQKQGGLLGEVDAPPAAAGRLTAPRWEELIHA